MINKLSSGAVQINQEDLSPALRTLASLPVSPTQLPPGDLTGHMLHANELNESP